MMRRCVSMMVEKNDNIAAGVFLLTAKNAKAAERKSQLSADVRSCEKIGLWRQASLPAVRFAVEDGQARRPAPTNFEIYSQLLPAGIVVRGRPRPRPLPCNPAQDVGAAHRMVTCGC